MPIGPERSGGDDARLFECRQRGGGGLFSERENKILEMAGIINKIMDIHKIIKSPSEEDIVNADRWARERTLNICKAGDR